MSSNNVQPMSGHLFWADGTETHVANIFTDFAQIPKKGLLVAVFRYIDPITLQEIVIDGAKIGHWLGGMDHYYFSGTGAGPNHVEYAMWNGPTSGSTRVTVYELKGFGVETARTDVRANTFPNQRIWDGALVSDQVYNAAVEKSWLY